VIAAVRIHKFVKRDYGSFGKSSTKILAPFVEPLGYIPCCGASFGRSKGLWIEGFFLQQSVDGSGDFSVNVGIHVPDLDTYWPPPSAKPTFGLLIAWRLSDSPPDYQGERWYHAKDKEQLARNLQLIAGYLTHADIWFTRFSTFSDVIEAYRIQSRLPETPHVDLQLVTVLNYAILLAINSEKQKSLAWFRYAATIHARPTYWNAKTGAIGFEASADTVKMKKTKDDEVRRHVIENSILRLES
jgi:hypothetical protein